VTATARLLTAAGIAVRQRAITTLVRYFTRHVLVQPSQTVVSPVRTAGRHPSSHSRNVTDQGDYMRENRRYTALSDR
jgi:hypothetical protein